MLIIDKNDCRSLLIMILNISTNEDELERFINLLLILFIK